ncbi:hypothetical protein L1887_38649 [Cichorium endivia]|nr:hypothetical protein L1887_38649 [Cichorium endivia]
MLVEGGGVCFIISGWGMWGIADGKLEGDEVSGYQGLVKKKVAGVTMGVVVVGGGCKGSGAVGASLWWVVASKGWGGDNRCIVEGKFKDRVGVNE